MSKRYVTRTGVEVEVPEYGAGHPTLVLPDGDRYCMNRHVFNALFQSVEEKRTCRTCGLINCHPECYKRNHWQPREPEPVAAPDEVAELRAEVAELRQLVEDHLAHHAGTKMEVRDE